jgi:hypothetical protein
MAQRRATIKNKIAIGFFLIPFYSFPRDNKFKSILVYFLHPYVIFLPGG